MKYLVTGATGGYGTYALGFLKELVPISDIAVWLAQKKKQLHLKRQVSMYVWLIIQI